MSRFVFVVPPLTGHINPTISVGRALVQRGHQVAWVGFPEPARKLLPDDAELIPVFDEIPADVVDLVLGKFRGLRRTSAFVALWEDFLLPLARAMVPGVEAAIERFKPDVVIVDQQAFAGAIAAQRRGLVWATSATTSAELTEPLADLPKVRAWVDEHLGALWSEFGVPEERRVDPRFSETLVLVFSSSLLVGGEREFPRHFAFVGPALDARPDAIPFDWDALRPGRRILVSLGTLSTNVGDRFFAAVREGFTQPDLQVILVAPPQEVGPVPEHILVRSSVPQLALLQRVDAVVSHGGHNTVCESLAAGLPLVVAPIRDDQPIIAEQVARSGAGVRISFGRVRGRDLRAAVDKVLDGPSYREAAQRIRSSFAAAGGAARAAGVLEELV